MGDGVLREEDITGSQDFDVSGDTDSLDRQAPCTQLLDTTSWQWANTCAACSIVHQGRSSSWTSAAGMNRQEVEELSADARRGGRGLPPQLLPDAPHGQLQVAQCARLHGSPART